MRAHASTLQVIRLKYKTRYLMVQPRNAKAFFRCVEETQFDPNVLLETKGCL